MSVILSKRTLTSDEVLYGEAVVSLNYADWGTWTVAMQDRPESIAPYEWFVQKHENHRAHVVEILAKANDVEYLKDLSELQMHPRMLESTEIRDCAEALDAVLLIDEKGVPYLAFASFDNLKRHRSLGLSEKLKNPIHVLTGNRLVTVCVDREILSRLTQTGAAGAFIPLAKDTENLWLEASANTPSQRRLATIINEAFSKNATDIDFDPRLDGKMQVYYRRYGKLVKHAQPFSMEEGTEITRFLMAKSRANPAGGRLHRPAEGALVYQSTSTGDINIRVSFLPLDRGGAESELISVSARLLPRSSKPISLANLKFSQKFIEAINPFFYMESGMLVMTGPTNSGKSTTIAGFINEHLRLYGDAKKRISMEDPVERQLPGVKQISVPNQLFETYFESILRHDPDLIWIGEIRSKVVAEVAIWAALTGHQVYTTLHASDTTIAYKALANKVSKDKWFELAESLQGFIGQRLVPELCSHCSLKDEEPTEAEQRAFRMKMLLDGVNAEIPQRVSHLHKDGCKECRYTGYMGLVPLVEILPFSRAVRDMFLERDNPSVAAIKNHRSISFYESGMELVAAGRIELPSIFI